MDTEIDTVAVTSPDSDERPWRRRSRLYGHEAEIRRLKSEGYSLSQIIRLLRLGVSRSYLWRFLNGAAAARPAGESAPAATPAAPAAPAAVDSAEAAADDAAALAVLDSSGFTPPTTRTHK